MPKELPESKNIFEGNKWILPASDFGLCRQATNEIEKRLIEVWEDEDSVYDIMPGINDLFWNSVVHGSYDINKKDKLNPEEKWLDVIKRLGLTTSKNVTVILDIKPDSMEITFQDEGPGYDPNDSSSEKEGLMAATGKGQVVIKEMNVFDEVIYDKANKSVTVRKKHSRV